jgi:sulfate adenylyltransferase
LNGGFSPLTGFLCEKDYLNILKNSRLQDQSLWTIPICLAITKEQKKLYEKEQKIILQDQTGVHIAYLFVEDIYPYDLEKECEAVFGVCDFHHPYQKEMKQKFEAGAKFYIGGKLEQIQAIQHYSFKDLRRSPSELKAIFLQKKFSKIVAFQTRNLLHKSHFHLTLKSLEKAGKDAKLLLHPVVGITQENDTNYYLRVNCYKKIMKYYKDKAILSLLPLSMRMAGPKEAVWHALIRKNFGATHFIVGRDHAGPSYNNKHDQKFYAPYEAQELLERYSEEIGIIPIHSKNILYVKELDSYLEEDKVQKNQTTLQLSGSQQREMIKKGEPIPEWFSFPEIAALMKNCSSRGFCVYFVGIPASGKSTLARVLEAKLQELDPQRTISVLDGDIIRKNLSKELGFSEKDRKTNIQRIGYVASEIVKHNGICIVANIAPFENSRAENRAVIEKMGSYIEVFVKTPLQECIKRDPKGLYKKAINNEISKLTGYNDTFEEPQNCDVVVHTAEKSVEDCIQKILLKIKKDGLIKKKQ